MAMAPITPAPEDLPDGSGDEISSGDIEPPAVLFINDSDSSSNSDEENAGYELLPQDIENEMTVNIITASESVIQENSDAEDSSRFALPSPPPEWEPTEVMFPEERDIHPMDEEHIQKIKAAMAGFTLPTSSVPHWAYVISEEEWKAQLISGLQVKRKCSQDKTDCDIESPNSKNSFTESISHQSSITPETNGELNEMELGESEKS